MLYRFLFPNIVLAVGLFMAAFGAQAYLDHKGFAGSSARVEAEVVERTPALMEHRTPQDGQLRLRYEYEGATYRVTTPARGRGWETLALGDRVELALHREDPKKFMIARQVGEVSVFGPFLACVGVILVGLGFGLRARSRRMR